MSNISFNSYITDYITNLNNVNDKPKAIFFINYIKTNFGDEALNSPDVFAVLDKDFLLDSVNSYINRSPAKGVAEDFRRTILSLCNNVCTKYKINNNFLDSNTEIRDFNDTTKIWFDSLKKTENKECLPFEKIEILNEAIRTFLATDNLEEKIIKCIESKTSTIDYYRKLVSTIALMLVQKYGLSNDAIPKIMTKDLNVEDRLLEVNDFNLYLDNELIYIFTIYIKCRNIIIKNNISDIDYLLITKEGKPYLNNNGYSENGKLFSLMKDTLGDTNVAGLRYSTIIQLVSRGANIKLLSKLTGVKTSTIAEICIDDASSLENIFKNVANLHTAERRIQKKGQLQCPYCGNYKEASSENWILIQIDGYEKKYIACRECKGLDGIFKY